MQDKIQNKIQERKPSKLMFAIKVIAGLMILSIILSSMISVFSSQDFSAMPGNVAVIYIEGPIVTETTSSMFFEEQLAVSGEIVDYIKRADENSQIKAILFMINSPGGSPVASEEIGNAIKQTNKTTVAYIRETGASGAYWIASACDKIVANRMAITGSIGVLSGGLEFTGLMDKYGVNYRRLIAGKYKDIGTPFRNMTIEEQDLYQTFLDQVHIYFIEEVAANRNMKFEDVKKISTGMFFLGSEAKELGLVDYLGDKETAIKLIETSANITAELVDYTTEKGFFEKLAGVSSQQSYSVGRGIGDSLLSPANVYSQPIAIT